MYLFFFILFLIYYIWYAYTRIDIEFIYCCVVLSFFCIIALTGIWSKISVVNICNQAYLKRC